MGKSHMHHSDGRDIRATPCHQLPELVLVGRTEIQKPLPALEIPFQSQCVNIYLGYKGSKQMQAQGRTYSLSGGEFFVTGPDIDHATGPMPVSKCAHYWLRVNLATPGPFCGSAELESLRARLSAVSLAHGRYSEGLFDQLRSLYTLATREPDAARDLELRLMLGLFLLKLLETIDADASGQAEPRVAVVKNHLQRHLGEDLSVQDMARLADCSVSALQQLFKKHEGVTPAEFFTRLRMAEAERLLLESSDSIRAISEQLGYANERHFSTAFKRYHAEPPGRFRAARQ